MFAYFNDIITDLRWRGINYVGDTVIEPSSRWRFGGKRKLRQRGKKDCTRGWNVPLWGRRGWEKEQRAALAALHRSIRLYHPGAPTPYRFPVFSRSRKHNRSLKLRKTRWFLGLCVFTRKLYRCCRVDRVEELWFIRGFSSFLYMKKRLKILFKKVQVVTAKIFCKQQIFRDKREHIRIFLIGLLDRCVYFSKKNRR